MSQGVGLTLRKHRDFDFDQSIVITGNEQNDYFKVLLKVVDLLMPELAGKTIHLSHGMLRFASGKMSSRKGNVITAESLLEQIKQNCARGSARRAIWMKKNAKPLPRSLLSARSNTPY